jgi:hypothetical protein
MTVATIINLALGLLQLVLSNIKGSGASVAGEITQGIEAAIASLQAVQGTPVTFQQLESLRVEPKW